MAKQTLCKYTDTDRATLWCALPHNIRTYTVNKYCVFVTRGVYKQHYHHSHQKTFTVYSIILYIRFTVLLFDLCWNSDSFFLWKEAKSIRGILQKRKSTDLSNVLIKIETLIKELTCTSRSIIIAHIFPLSHACPVCFRPRGREWQRRSRTRR